jgi:hypothetical protein
MAGSTLYTIVGATGLFLIAVLTLWKITVSVQSGMMQMDINWFFGASDNDDRSLISFSRAAFPRLFWSAVAVLAVLATLALLFAFAVARAGIH